MKQKTTKLQKRLYLIALIILLVGLGSATVIYVNAARDEAALEEGEVSSSYPIMPEDSRMYRHNLEVYGGKTSLAMDDFMRWFSDLWHGKTLAFTIAFITIGISLVVLFSASFAIDLHSAAQDEDKQATTS